MSKLERKQELTEVLIKTVKTGDAYRFFNESWKQYSGDDLEIRDRKQFWRDPYSDSLQLSSLGNQVYRRAKKPYIFAVTRPASANVWRHLKNCLEGPFHLNEKKLYLYDDKDLVIVQLHSGDFVKFVENQLTNDDD